MSKEHSRDTVRIQNGAVNMKHSLPRELCSLIFSFNDIPFVECVGIGKYSATKKTLINILGFDDNTNSYVVDLFKSGYKQRIFLKTGEKNTDYESSIKEHFDNFDERNYR